MHHFVPQNLRPIVFRFQFAGRRQGQHLAGTRPDRADERQADHPGAEPTMAAGGAAAAEDFDQRFASRGEAQPLRQLRINLLLQAAGGIAGEQLVVASVELDDEMIRFDHRIALEQVEHFELVFHPHVERVDGKRFGQQFCRLGLLAQPHQHEAQLPTGRNELRHSLLGEAIVFGGPRKAPHPVAAFAGREKELAAMRVAGGYFLDQRRHARRRLAAGPAIDRFVGGGEAAKRPFVTRIESPSRFQHVNRLGRANIGQQPIGSQLMRPEQFWIDLQGPVDGCLGRSQVEAGQRQRRPGGVQIGRLRIDRQARRNLRRPISFVELFQEQSSRFKPGRPEILVQPQGRRENVAHQAAKRVAVPGPAGMLRQPATNHRQIERIINPRRSVVIAEKPGILLLGFVQLPSRLSATLHASSARRRNPYQALRRQRHVFQPPHDRRGGGPARPTRPGLRPIWENARLPDRGP